MRIAWVAPQRRLCGIADYSDALFPAVREALRAEGGDATLVSLDEHRSVDRVVAALVRDAPDAVHFQHEYGLFGGKNPPRYRFPRLVRHVTDALPRALRLATAHTVLPPHHAFPLRGRGAQIPLRWAANTFLLPHLRRVWGRDTWGGLDGIVVHSPACVAAVRDAAPRARIEVIPHFVPVRPAAPRTPAHAGQTIVMFGFVAPGKGQHLAIEALARLGPEHRLVIAGGPRRNADRAYLAACLQSAETLGVAARVEVTGTLDEDRIDAVLARADLVVAPLVVSTGSGSVARALALGLPVLASDLPVNAEIAAAAPGAIALFRTGDAADLAARARELLADAAATDRLRAGARVYAALRSPEVVARQHVEFLRTVAAGRSAR